MNLKAPKLITNSLRPGKRLWTAQRKVSGPGAYMLTEALVYIGVLFVLLGVGYAALYRCIENSVALLVGSPTMPTGFRCESKPRFLSAQSLPSCNP